MYEDSIKRLRFAAQLADKGLVITPSICLEAADAIEAMNHELKSLYKLLGTHPDPRGENGDAGVGRNEYEL